VGGGGSGDGGGLRFAGHGTKGCEANADRGAKRWGGRGGNENGRCR